MPSWTTLISKGGTRSFAPELDAVVSIRKRCCLTSVGRRLTCSGLLLAVLRRWADTKDLRALQYRVSHVFPVRLLPARMLLHVRCEAVKHPADGAAWNFRAYLAATGLEPFQKKVYVVVIARSSYQLFYLRDVRTAGNHDWIDGLETFQRHILHKARARPLLARLPDYTGTTVAHVTCCLHLVTLYGSNCHAAVSRRDQSSIRISRP